MNGYADGDSDDSAECNGSGVDDRSGVEDHHAWRRAGNGNGKECIRAMVLRELRRVQGRGDVKPYVPAASASKTKSMVRWSALQDFKPPECDGEICRTKAR